MMTKEIEKRYNNIVMLTGKNPTEIEMNKKEYETLVEECIDMKVADFTELLDKEGNPINPSL